MAVPTAWQDRVSVWAVPSAVAVVSLWLIVQYLRLPTLGVYDAAGQVAAVKHAMTFWPAWSGWQSHELLGWPQGLLYPPGVHWVMAGLALLIGVTVSVKLVVVASIAALPVSIWWYARKLGVAVRWQWPVVAVVMIVLLIAPDYLGSSYTGLFRLGLIPNFVAMPVFFLALGTLEAVREQASRRRVILAGITVAAVIWLHLVAAMVLAIYGLVLAVMTLVRGNRRSWWGLVSAAGLGLLVSAPFWLPMIRASAGGIAQHGSIASMIVGNVVLLALGGGVLVLGLWKSAKTTSIVTVPLTVSILLALVGVADGLLARKYGAGSILGWLNAYRFQIFALIFAAVGLMSLAGAYIDARLSSLRPWKIGGLAFLIVGLVALRGPGRFAYARVQITHDPQLNGRFLEDFRRSESYPAPYTFQEELVASDGDASWAYGLFIESAGNSAYVKSLSRSLRPGAYSGEASINEPEDDTIDSAKVDAMLKYLGIRYVVSLNDQADSANGTWERLGVTQYYHLSDRGETPLAEVAKWPLRAVTANWSAAVLAWWKAPGAVSDLPYDARTGELPATQAANEGVKVISWNDTQIELEVNGSGVVPVVVKTTYAPGWSASAVDGSSVKIWRVAPDMMLIAAKAGRETLKYR